MPAAFTELMILCANALLRLYYKVIAAIIIYVFLL
jgi:hypothetical protein